MKTKILALGILALASGCGPKLVKEAPQSPDYSGFEEIVDLFVQEAATRGRTVDLSHFQMRQVASIDTSIFLRGEHNHDEDSHIEARSGIPIRNSVGYCDDPQSGRGPTVIVTNRLYEFSADEIEAITFHLFAHCLLKLKKHDNRLDSAQRQLSLTHELTVRGSDYAAFRTEYLDELFSRQE